MRIATIRGHVTSSIKHESLQGCRLLLAEPVSPDLGPLIVLDQLGAAIGQMVMISSDGHEARKILGDAHTPARWTILGIVDADGGSAK